MTFAAPAGAAAQSGVDSIIGVNMGGSGTAEWALTLTVVAAGPNGFVAGSVPGVAASDVSGAHPRIGIASTQLFAFDSSGKQMSVTAAGTVVCGAVKDVP